MASGGSRRHLVALLLGVVTGLGHIYMRRRLKGVLLFYLFAAAANGVFIGRFWQGDAAPWIFNASLAAGLSTWVYGVLDLWRLTFGTDREALRVERDRLLREGLQRYLKGEDRAAKERLERALALDVDRADACVRFHMAVVSRRLGDVRGARRMLDRCEDVDEDGKWRYEVQEERTRLRAIERGERNGSG